MEKIAKQDSFEAYLGAKEYFSAGDLTALAKSPANYMHSLRNVRPESQAQKIGRAIHSRILTPLAYLDEFTRYDEQALKPEPDKDFRSAKNKEARASFFALCEATNTTPLNAEEYDRIEGMYNALMSNSTARRLLEDGTTEMSHYMQDSDTGLMVRFRPDFISNSKPYYISLKKTIDASPEGFAREAIKYGYHYKEAFYFDMLNQFYPGRFERAYFIAIEESEPYLHTVQMISNEALEYGRHVYKTYLRRYIDCLHSNKWPGYEFYSESESGIVTFDIPAYAQKLLSK